MKHLSIIAVLILSFGLMGCEDVTNQLGITEKKDDGPDKSCYGFFYDPVDDRYKDRNGGGVNCFEDLDSIQYRVYYNRCTGGDEIVGYNSSGYCSNSRCNMDDRKRGYHTMPNGVRVECGFSTPSYIQDFYQGGNTGYQYRQPTGNSYQPFGYQRGYYNNNVGGYRPYYY